ncbi:MAG TPA: 4Fe-4S binding protein [Candidatus Brocadiia bacterium]|nr:4Fe-4S binding protein [Candidatus Brocadiia bacterium]
MSAKRKIIRIDEEKCDGCGQCATACAEGALKIIDGKARLVSETYCDGLGACIGECPRGALTIEERPAEDFDVKAVERNLKNEGRKPFSHAAHSHGSHTCPGSAALDMRRVTGRAGGGHACPSAAAFQLRGASESAGGRKCAEPESRLRNWPVQLKLAPTAAPYYEGAKLLIAADCAPFAFANFHERFVADRIVMIGCPKLDDGEFYREKLAEIFRENDIREIEVAHMEVPCCFGLVYIVKGALEDSGRDIPLTVTKVGIRGEIQSSERE